MAGQQQFYGWRLVCTLFVLYLLNFGFPLYGGLIAHSYMVKALSLNRATFGMGMTVFNIVMGLMSLPIAWTIPKWGIKGTVLIGSLLLLIGTVIMSNAYQAWHYILGFGVFIGAGVGFSTTVPFTTAATRWFRRYRGRAIGIIMAAGGIGGFVASPAINRLMMFNNGNWQQSWLVIGGFCVAGAIVSFVFIKESPEAMGQYQDGIAPGSIQQQTDNASRLSTDYAWSAVEGFKTAAYWLIVFVAFTMYFPYFLVQAHWIFQAKVMGIATADAAWSMGLFTLAGVFGRLIGGWLQDFFPARNVYVVGLALMAVGTAIGGLLAGGSTLLFFAASCVLGFGFGSSLTSFATIVGNYFGSEAFPRLYGTAFMIALVISSFAGIIGGKLFDLNKNYTLAWEICISISSIGIIALFFTVPPQPDSARVLQSDLKRAI